MNLVLKAMIKYSLVIPVYGNEDNIPDLFHELRKLHKKYSNEIEIVFVVDASPDNCWTILKDRLNEESFNCQLILHSRNFGSFPSIRTGFIAARGDYVAAMAADMQEPLELIFQFFHTLENDHADVVLGQREGRNDPFVSRMFSNLFWGLYRRFVIPDMPSGGVDVFGCNNKVIEVLKDMYETHSSLVVQLFWVGFRRKFIGYVRRERTKGVSQWSIKKKMAYFMDSVFSFSDLPMRLLMFVGGVGIIGSVLLATITLGFWLAGEITVQGYAMQILFICFIFFVLVFFQGVVGSYVWRCYENTKNRPLSLTSAHHVYGIDEECNDN